MALLNYDIEIIGTTFIKDNTVIPETLDDSYIVPAIIQVQNEDIQYLLGTPLYQRIINDISGGTLTGTYYTLVYDYLAYTIMYYTVYHALMNMYVKIMNTTITHMNDSTISTRVNEDLFEKYKDQFLKMAEFYANRTRLYIITQNQYGQLMEYVTYVANPDTIIPNQTAQGTFNKSGFHFKRRSNNRYRPAGCNDCFGSKDSFGIGNAYQGFN